MGTMRHSAHQSNRTTEYLSAMAAGVEPRPLQLITRYGWRAMKGSRLGATDYLGTVQVLVLYLVLVRVCGPSFTADNRCSTP